MSKQGHFRRVRGTGCTTQHNLLFGGGQWYTVVAYLRVCDAIQVDPKYQLAGGHVVPDCCLSCVYSC